jgi:terminase small subunit / prophage DNA-packing protein
MSTINHDTAARLLGISPGELESLVKDGAVRRQGRDAYMLPVLVGDYCKHLRQLPSLIERGPKQAEIAEHLDISERSVRELLDEQELDHKQCSLSEIRVAYIRHLREVAAGRGGEDGITLVKERALLAREMRIAKAMQNAERRGALAPVGVLEQVLASTGAKIGKILATIKGEIRRRFPQLTSSDLAAVDAIVAKAMAQAAGLSLSALQAEEEAERGEGAEPAEPEAEAA